MSVNEEQFGSLYSDERDKPLLSPTAQKKFEEYQEKLANLSKMIRENDYGSEESSPWQVWENGLRQLYKEMIYDAFDALGVEMPKDMEVHFAGSLAKAQATEFSDLDAFVIVKNDEDIKKVKPVFDALNNLCQRIFTASNQLYPDPIGINPSRLIGTPDDLFGMLKDGMVADVEATAMSILTSKPVLPRYELGEELRDKIKQEPSFSNMVSAKKFYNKAIKDFTAPKEGAEVVSVKTHIMRPIDFMLMGLREEFNLYSEDGAHLSAPGTIRLLREKNLLPEEQIARIESVYNQAMSKRFDLHAEHKKEHDEMPYSDAKEMLDEVAKIRELGVQRVTRIENLENAKKLWDNANSMLEKGNISGYLKAANELHKFMKEKNLKEDDLRPELSDKTISPKGYAILQSLWGAASDYSRAAATLTESTIEPGLVSAVNKMSAFFMDCKLSPNERATPDPDFNLGKSKILVGIMQFIKDVADPNSQIWQHNTKALMNYKIAAIQKLEKSNNVNDDTLESVLSSKGENLSEYLSYKYATKDEGREHRYKASTENFKNVKEKYQQMRGDALKTEILADFKNKLAEATDEQSLKQIVKELKGKDEYKILATGQGLTTQLLGLKTSSVSAFEKMVEETRESIKSQERQTMKIK
ncbi:Uncharacterised protein [Legionella pneumophila]|nr:Uncharacterised protein [Legionella pneumophila]